MTKSNISNMGITSTQIHKYNTLQFIIKIYNINAIKLSHKSKLIYHYKFQNFYANASNNKHFNNYILLDTDQVTLFSTKIKATDCAILSRYCTVQLTLNDNIFLPL